jgi:hypothetical protein
MLLYNCGPYSAIYLLALVIQLLLEVFYDLAPTGYIRMIFSFQVQIYLKRFPTPMERAVDIGFVVVVDIASGVVIPVRLKCCQQYSVKHYLRERVVASDPTSVRAHGPLIPRL